MFNWLLSSSGDNVPDWTTDPQIDNNSMLIGLLIGIGVVLILFGTVTVIKFLFSYNEKINKANNKKSDI